MLTIDRIVAPLVVVCLTGSLATSAEALCEFGDWDSFGNFHELIATAKAADVVQCIEAGADVQRHGSQSTPLHYAVEFSKDPAVVKALIQAGADVNAYADALVRYTDATGRTYFFDLLFGVLPLHLAAQHNNNIEIIRILLDAGADVNGRMEPSRHGVGGEDTPLHFAASRSNDPALILALIEAGADLEARNRLGWTPLYQAAYNSDEPAVLTVLLDAGADPAARDRRGEPPVSELIERSRRGFIDLDLSVPKGPWANVFTRLLEGQR